MMLSSAPWSKSLARAGTVARQYEYSTKHHGRTMRDVLVSEAAKLLPAHPKGSRIARSPVTTPATRAGQIVLVDANGIDRITLDVLGRRVWQRLADEPTLPALIESLRDERIRIDLIAEEVVRLLVRWREANVIAWR